MNFFYIFLFVCAPLLMPDAVEQNTTLPSNQADPVICASSALQQTYKYIDRRVA